MTPGYANQAYIPSAGAQASGYVGTGLVGKDVVEPISVLDSIERTMQNNLSCMHTLTQRLANVADRVLGSQPQGVDGKSSAAPPSLCMTRKLDDQNGFMAASIEQLANHIERLERL